ncbi:MAG: YbhB/YbcL family Raf kinase inhibitor-like protein [Thermomicrobiales bacterium]
MRNPLVNRRMLLGQGVAAGVGAAGVNCFGRQVAAAQSTPTVEQPQAGCDPLALLPVVPSFTLSSTDVADGEVMGTPQMSGIAGAGGQDRSPQLTWSGFPDTTMSFCVTMYDPDAATESGFWHWAVVDVPGNVTALASGAGAAGDGQLPAGAFQLPNDLRLAQYLGAAPPPTDPPHRYYLVVSALDVTSLGVPKDATPAFLGFNIGQHIVGRAVLVPLARGQAAGTPAAGTPAP